MQQYNSNSPSYQDSNNYNEMRESDGSCDGYIGINSNNDINYHNNNNNQNDNQYYKMRPTNRNSNHNNKYYQQDNYINDRRYLMREAPEIYFAYDSNNCTRNNVVKTPEKISIIHLMKDMFSTVR